MKNITSVGLAWHHSSVASRFDDLTDSKTDACERQPTLDFQQFVNPKASSLVLVVLC